MGVEPAFENNPVTFFFVHKMLLLCKLLLRQMWQHALGGPTHETRFELVRHGYLLAFPTGPNNLIQSFDSWFLSTYMASLAELATNGLLEPTLDAFLLRRLVNVGICPKTDIQPLNHNRSPYACLLETCHDI